MELTNEQLEQVREMAAALMPAGEIAILLGLDKEAGSVRGDVPQPRAVALYLAYRQGGVAYEVRAEAHRHQAGQVWQSCRPTSG